MVLQSAISRHCRGVEDAGRELRRSHDQRRPDLAALDRRRHAAQHHRHRRGGHQLQDDGDDAPEHDVGHVDAVRQHRRQRYRQRQHLAGEDDRRRDIAFAQEAQLAIGREREIDDEAGEKDAGGDGKLQKQHRKPGEHAVPGGDHGCPPMAGMPTIARFGCR
jgi:hypothetical protein